MFGWLSRILATQWLRSRVPADATVAGATAVSLLPLPAAGSDPGRGPPAAASDDPERGSDGALLTFACISTSPSVASAGNGGTQYGVVRGS